MRRRRLLWTAGLAGLGVLYLKVVRPATMRWGATDEEVTRRLPGDEVVAGNRYRATRAITIEARPEHIWPWIVQIGSGRAGWYALDRIDNQGVPSARRIIPEFQDLQVGDLIPMVVGKQVGPRVKELEPPRRMLWATGDEFSWEWVLDPIDQGRTRLITRMQERYPPLFSRKTLYTTVASTGDIVMHWKQLRGIKQRAERLAAAADPVSPGPADTAAGRAP